MAITRLERLQLTFGYPSQRQIPSVPHAMPSDGSNHCIVILPRGNEISYLLVAHCELCAWKGVPEGQRDTVIAVIRHTQLAAGADREGIFM